MLLRCFYYAVGLGLSLYPLQDSFGEREFIGLAPSMGVRGKVESQTASAADTDTLFYNPALLSHQEFGLSLFEVGALADRGSLKKYQQTPATLDEVRAEVESSRRSVYSEAGVDALQITLPYLAVAGYGGTSIRSYERFDDETQDDGYFLEAKNQVGMIAGMAVSYRRLSLGYAQYRQIQGTIHVQPTVEENQITDVRYGGTTGHNAGAFYQLFSRDNPSGIGVSVLNAGGSKYQSHAPLNNSHVKEYEQQGYDYAEESGLLVSRPDAEPQITNIGLNLEAEELARVFHVQISADINDLGGNTIDHKVGVAGEFGIVLPDKLAMAASTFVFSKDKFKVPVHIGFRELSIFGGVRPGDYYTSGARLGLHMGFDRSVSLLNLEVEGMSLTPLPGSQKPSIVGISGAVGLMLIF